MRDVKRALFSAVFAVVCHLAWASVVFGAPPVKAACPCVDGGQCVCGDNCQCKATVKEVALAVAADKSAPAAPAPVQTYHYEYRCNGGFCTQVLVPDAPPQAGAGAPAACSACAGCQTMTGGCAGCQSAEPPMAGGGHRLLHRLTHPFGGRLRSRGCRGCG